VKITKAFLKKHDACADAYEWYLEQKTTDGDKLFKTAMKAKMYDEIWWVLRRKLNKKQSVKIAIYSAEQVKDIFEKRHPNDNRPRKAIQTAKRYLKTPTSSAYAAAASAYAASADAASAYAASYASVYEEKRKVQKKILRYAWRVINDNN